MHRPLLGPSECLGPDLEAVDAEIALRAPDNRTAYELVSRWAIDAEQVRADRGAVNQAVGLPLPNRELREWVMADAQTAGVEAPSLNRVRKELQRWVHEQVLAEVGPIQPNGGDLNRQIGQIRSIVARLLPDARDETARIVRRSGDGSNLAHVRVEEVECEKEHIPE